jgi:predicted ATPase
VSNAPRIAGSRYTPELTFRVTNFKSIASVELPPARLVVLAGSNSSGKSSLLQAALFITQSLAANTSIINGDLVILGEPKDVIRDGTADVSFEFGFEREAPEVDTHRRSAYRVTLSSSKGELGVTGVSLGDDRGRILCSAIPPAPVPSIRRGLTSRETLLPLLDPKSLGLPSESYLSLVGLKPARLIYRASAESLRTSFDEILDGGSAMSYYVLQELVFDVLRSRPESEIPQSLQRVIADLRHGRNPAERLKKLRKSLGSAELDLLFDLYADSVAPEGWDSDGISLPPMGRRTGIFAPPPSEALKGGRPIDPLIKELEQAARQMDSFASSVVYLGPLRDDPRVAYPLGHTISSLPVGRKGEFTAAFLEKQRLSSVRYADPEGRLRTDTLMVAASKWCRYLGIAENVSVSAKGKLGHELSLELDGHHRDPTAIGVGASQLLPVVVLVLGAKRGQLVLLEQPELHLHPKVQSRLADFFAFAREDVQILVETHSEYLITRLRVRVAQGRLDPSQVAALFVSKRASETRGTAQESTSDPGELYSEFQLLHLDDFGNFDSWPRDFFDSLDHDSVELADAVTTRLRERSEPDNPSQ